MVSPDFSAYVDLRINDRDAEDLVSDAVVNLQQELPDWNPRAGNVEMVLIETFALMAEEIIFSQNRIPDGIMQAVLGLYGINRDEGAAPTATFRFSMSGTVGYTIPEGTNIGVESVTGDEPVVFQTDVELVIPPDSTYGLVTATGTELTGRVNGTPGGTEVELIDGNAYVNTVTVEDVIANGRDVEDDEGYLDRATTYLQRISDTLVTAQDFKNYVMEFSYVKRALALDMFNPASPGVESPGYTAVAVYGQGTVLTSAQKAEIAQEVSVRKQANLVFNLVDATTTAVPVTASVGYLDGFSEAQVVNGIDNALTEYLNPDTWAWGGKVRRNELIQLISNVEGVDYVTELVAPADDVVLAPTAFPVKGAVDITADPASL